MVVDLVIAAEIHIAPTLKAPFELIVNTGLGGIIQNRTVTALTKPLNGGVVHREQIVGRVVDGHVVDFGVAFHDHRGQRRVGHFSAREANT